MNNLLSIKSNKYNICLQNIVGLQYNTTEGGNSVQNKNKEKNKENKQKSVHSGNYCVPVGAN